LEEGGIVDEIEGLILVAVASGILLGLGLLGLFIPLWEVLEMPETVEV
jgi:hypothetical protein